MHARRVGLDPGAAREREFSHGRSLDLSRYWPPGRRARPAGPCGSPATTGPRPATPRHHRCGRRSRARPGRDRKSTRLNSSHTVISYAVFCLKKKKKTTNTNNIKKKKKTKK